MNKGNPAAHRAFTTIAYQIPDVSTKEDVLTLFDVLAGENSMSDALLVCKHGSALTQYAESHNPETWKPLKYWTEWWTQPKHLGRLLLPAAFCKNKKSLLFYKQVCCVGAIRQMRLSRWFLIPQMQSSLTTGLQRETVLTSSGLH